MFNWKYLLGLDNNSKNEAIDIEEQHREQMTHVRYVFAILVIVIGFLGISLQSVSNNNTTNIELPPALYTSGNIKVGNGWANDVMFKVWGEWLVYSTATFAPGTIKEKLNDAVRFFNQEKVGLYQGQFGALSNMVIRHSIKQTFTVHEPVYEFYKDVEMVDVASTEEEIKSAKITYYGVASQAIGPKVLPDRKCQYVITIKLEGNHLYGNSYDTDCFK